MTAVRDETLCGPLCQHPTCWEAQRRIIRGVPHMQTEMPESSDESDSDCELPTQKVVNLFGDTAAKLQLKHDNIPEPTHYARRSKSSPRNSYTKPLVPNGTPASGRPTTRNTSSSKDLPPRLRNIEVQEVFDLTDLENNWDETFLAKKFYVWMPSDRQPTQREDSKDPQTHRLKDVTEDMIPREIEMARYSENMKNYIPGRKSPSTFFHPPAATYFMSKQGYHGLHELLDLPRDVLVALMNNIPERDMLDPDRFAHALLRTLPKLEKQNKCVSLAYGNVLYQTKKPILNGKSKFVKTDYENPPGQQTFKMDSQFWEKIVHANGDLDGQANSKIIPSHPGGDVSSPSINGKSPLPGILHNGGSTAPQMNPQLKQETRNTAKGKPDYKKLPPSVNIGLPELPSHFRPTRPFQYKQNNLTFTLEPRDPSMLMQRTELSPSVENKMADGYDERPCSEVSTERSSIKVRMPLVTPKAEGDGQKMSQKQNEKITSTKRTSGQTFLEMHSAKIPRPPPTTPMNVYSSRTTPALSASIQDRNGSLKPIKEDGVKTSTKGPEVRQLILKSRSGRSVRFAAEVDEAAATLIEGLDLASDGSLTSRVSALAASSEVHSEQNFGEDGVIIPRGHATPRGHMTPLVTPEPKWPQLDEEAIREATKTPIEDPPSVIGTYHDQVPDMVSSANRYRRLWAERTETSQSPGPPPPSPEPHQYPSAMMPSRGRSPLSMLPKEFTRTDSGFTISARPPSTLDDTSRIQTPASFKSKPQFLSREPTQTDLPTLAKAIAQTNAVDTEPATTDVNQELEEMNSTNYNQESGPTTHSNIAVNDEPRNTNPSGNYREIDTDKDGKINENQNNTTEIDENANDENQDKISNSAESADNTQKNIEKDDDDSTKFHTNSEKEEQAEVENKAPSDNNEMKNETGPFSEDAENAVSNPIASDNQLSANGSEELTVTMAAAAAADISAVQTPDGPNFKPGEYQGPLALDQVFKDQELTKAVSQLDQFDTSEVQLAEELKKEIEKLEQ